jgi:hypothetical protein
MSDRRTHGYCPRCEEVSAVDPAGRCLWCDAETTPEKTPAPVAPCRYRDAHLIVLFAAHERGQAVSTLARQTFDRVGHESPTEAQAAIERGWVRLGLVVPTPEGRRCKGIVTHWGPTQGQRCSQLPRRGSDYCRAHEPALIEQKAEDRARAKAAQYVPLEPFAAWLRRLREELGTWEAVGEAVSRHHTVPYRYARGQSSTGKPTDRIKRSLVVAMLEEHGRVKFEDLYPTAASASVGEAG